MAGGLLEVLGKPLPEEDDEESPDAMGSAKQKKLRAIRRLFAAMKSNDAEAGAEAFADAFHACEMYEGDDDAPEPDLGAPDEEE